MKKIFTLIMLALPCVTFAQNKPQIPNGDFEDWSNVTDANTAPNGWNSFETATGGDAAAFVTSAHQVSQSDDVRPGSTGKSSAKLNSRNVFFLINAQGNLTTGRIYAGAYQAADKENYNFSDITDDNYCCKLGVMPDSIVFWAKFVPEKDSYEARMAAIVHDSYNYKTLGTDKFDAEDTENASHAVAKAVINFKTEKDADGNAKWVRYSIPFSTEGCTATSPDYIIVNFATNSYPGGGGKKDYLYIDDVELVYNWWDFTDKLVVSINDNSTEPMESTIHIEKQDNGKYTLSLKNFVLANADADMPIGNVTVTDVEGVEQPDGTILLNQEQSVMLENGDDPNIDFWMGPTICAQTGAIPVKINATMGEKLDANIDIDLTSSLGQKIHVGFGEVATSIKNVTTASQTQSDVIYNLSGQRVGKDYKGIVIINGRKVRQ